MKLRKFHVTPITVYFKGRKIGIIENSTELYMLQLDVLNKKVTADVLLVSEAGVECTLNEYGNIRGDVNSLLHGLDNWYALVGELALKQVQLRELNRSKMNK